MRGEAPVAMMTDLARIVRSLRTSLRGIDEKSTAVTSACSKRVPKRVACSRMFCVSWKPSTPWGKPGKFSTSLVVVSCPPGRGPSRTSGLRLARAV